MTVKAKPQTIDLATVEAGDQLVVQDDHNNVLMGPAVVTGDQLMVDGFGTRIVVGQTNRAGRMSAVAGVRVVGHQQRLFA